MRIDRFIISPAEVKLDTGFILNNPNLQPHPREDGYHVAAICKNIAIRLGIKNWEEVETWEDESSRSSFIANWGMYMGLIWEAAIFQSIPDVSVQPCPGAHINIGKHKVFGTPDGVSVGKWLDGTERIIGHECKYTKTSSRKDFSSMMLWHWQAMFYGQPEILDTRYWIFHVMHINGEYEKYRLGGEQYIQYYVEFTQDDMAGIRAMIASYLDNEKISIKGANIINL